MRLILPLLASLTLLSGCANKDGLGTSKVTNDFCAVARPITISGADTLTRETAEEILAHNMLGGDLCGWKAKPVGLTPVFMAARK